MILQLESSFSYDLLLVAAVVTLFITILTYYWYKVLPYTKFPSARFELKLLYWTLKSKSVTGDVFRAILENCKRYENEGMYVVWLFKPILVIFGEEIVKCINQDASVTDKASIYEAMVCTAGKGLLTSDGKNWKIQKKVVQGAFQARAIKTYTAIMNENARILVKNLSDEKGKAIDDILHVMAECNLRILYESNFGVEDKNKKRDEMTVKLCKLLTEFLTNRIMNPWLYFNFTLHILPYTRKILRLNNELQNSFKQILENIKESMTSVKVSAANNGQEQPVDLDVKPKMAGELLIEDFLKNSNKSMRELAKDISFLIVAGFETQANAMMWSLFMLGLHQDIQERLYDEISSVEVKEIELKDVQNLNLLDSVIKESLRLYTVPLFGRRLQKDVQFKNHLIPKNTDILIISYALHRNPDIYPDPEEFNPDRFMDKNSKIKPSNFIPFAEGARPCIGKNYALVAMKILIIHILRNFRIIALDRLEDMEYKYSIVLSCTKAPRLKFVPRNSLKE